MSIDTQSHPNYNYNEVVSLQTLQRIQKAMAKQPRHLSSLKANQAKRLSLPYQQLRNASAAMHDASEVMRSASTAVMQGHTQTLASLTPIIGRFLEIHLVKKLIKAICNWSTISFSLVLVCLNVSFFSFSRFFSFREIYIFENSNFFKNSYSLDSGLPIINQGMQNLNIYLLHYNISGQLVYSLFYQILFSLAGLSIFLIISSNITPEFINRLQNKLQRIILCYFFSATLSIIYLFNSTSMSIFFSGNLDNLLTYLGAPIVFWGVLFTFDYFQKNPPQLKLKTDSEDQKFLNLQSLYVLLISSLGLLLYTRVASTSTVVVVTAAILLKIGKMVYTKIISQKTTPSIYFQQHKFKWPKFGRPTFKFLPIILVSLPSLLLYFLALYNYISVQNLNWLGNSNNFAWNMLGLSAISLAIFFSLNFTHSKKALFRFAIAIISLFILVSTTINIVAFRGIQNDLNYIQKPDILNQLSNYCSPDKVAVILPQSPQSTTFFSPTTPVNTDYFATSCSRRKLSDFEFSSIIKQYLLTIDESIPEDRQDVTNQYIANLRDSKLGDYLIVEDFNNPTLKAFNKILGSYYPPLLSQDSTKVYKIG